MTPEEARELGRVVGAAAGDVAGHVEDLHLAVLDRGYAVASALVGRPATEVRVAHEGITRGTYAVVRAGLRAGGAVVGWLASRRADGEPLAARPRVHAGVAAFNGILGSRHHHDDSPLHLGMTLRAGGRDIAPTREGVAAAYPGAAGRVVVFLHGLVHTEQVWAYRAQEWWGDAESTHGRRLERDGGWTPVWLRYNSGAPIRDNGARLVDLVGRLVDAWPTAVTEIALVGHSMGGLVAHSGLAQAVGDAPWVERVRTVVTLGTPHGGSMVAQGVALGGTALERLPETRWLARLLDSRSEGVRDLQDGRLTLDTTAPVLLREGVRHCVVVGTVAAEATGVAGRAVGDLLVLPRQAGIDPARGAVAADDVAVIGQVSHLGLLNHPAVYERLRAWLAPA